MRTSSRRCQPCQLSVVSFICTTTPRSNADKAWRNCGLRNPSEIGLEDLRHDLKFDRAARRQQRDRHAEGGQAGEQRGKDSADGAPYGSNNH